jgi:hypothetical protein
VWVVLALSTVVSAGAGSVHAQEGSWSLTASAASGTYIFTERTNSFTVSTLGALTLGRLEITASLPWILQNGGIVGMVGEFPTPTGGTDHGVVAGRQPGETVPADKGKGKGPGPGGNASPRTPLIALALQTSSEDGDSSVAFDDAYRGAIADPLVGAGVELFRGTGVVRSVRVRGEAKIPVTDLEDGIGTGEWDFGAGGTLFVGSGRTFLFADLAWWRYGDLPELELSDGLVYGLGVSRSVAEARGSLSLTLSGATRIIDTLDPPLSLGAGLGWQVRPGWSLSVGGHAGLTEASADYGFHTGLSITIG